MVLEETVGSGLIDSYLNNRKFTVKYEVSSSNITIYSDTSSIEYGTPKGFCLGPLFLIFNNDLYQNLEYILQCRAILFVDDTIVYKRT